ncbi:GFA family protein [Dokdonella sp.]|uniref:GFA family protein n=1 Tax=Dokdonella sp. TaxID=2291710 RepID=UPI0026209268|nr:GFA family protein [Dokdonella sp.]
MTTHAGSCHCGRIQFEVDADVDKVIDCNCSMCSRRGGLLFFVPDAQMRLKTPETDLSTYTFNKHHIRHHFCPTCGIAPFGRGAGRDGQAMWAINARCLPDLDLGALTIEKVDGRRF